MTGKQLALLGAKLAFSALLLWVVLNKVDVAGILARLRAANIRWLIPGLLMGPVVVVLSAWRWHLLSLGLLGMGETIRYTWIGLFFGSILPGVAGGDLAKGVSLAAKQSRSRDPRLPISIVVDKLVGLWVLLLQFSIVAFVMLAVQPLLLTGLRGVLWLAGAATAGGLTAGIAICQPRGAAWFRKAAKRFPSAVLRSWADRALAAIGTYEGHGSVLLAAALLSLAIHFLNAVSFWMVMHALAIPASIWFAAVFYPMLSVLLALPVSVSGVGVRDVFSASIFTAFGLNPESGVAFSWLLLGLSIPNVLAGGTIQLWEVFRHHASD